MTDKETALFLKGKIESLKRQLSQCQKVSNRCKTKSTALANLVKRLRIVINRSKTKT